MNSSIDESRMGNGRTTVAAPASQVAWNAVTNARLVGPISAT